MSDGPSDVEDGIHMHVTARGKLMLVARKGEESLTFQLTVPQARQLRSELQSTVSELHKAHGRVGGEQ